MFKTMNKSVCYVGNTLVLLGFWFSVLLTQALAQTINAAPQGDNAIWHSSTTISGSQAFIDASAWCNGDCQGVDFCTMVNEALVTLPTQGGVVDARGLVYPNDGNETCTVNPFAGITVPSTVLLPPAVIKIQATWVLPSNTRIIGEGRQTDLRATSTFTPDSSSPVEAMVEMGNANVCSSGCTGISIEHLKIDGSNNLIVPPSNVGLTGIYNNYAQDSSYVDDVNLYDIGAVSYTQSTLTTGLLIGPGAAGSGPYSNINFAGSAICSCAHSQSNCTCTPTACVQIEAQTRGLHGITCSGASDQTPGDGPWAGIYLDASNNTIEDVHNEAFYDAIVVGDNADGLNATVAGNVISNVSGGYGGTGPTTNTIHICNPSYGSQTGACSATSDHITDLGIFQANSSGGYKNGVTGYHATTIEDDLTGTTINSNAYPTYVGTYILGELVGTSQYSRFTTSLGSTNGSSVTVPTWAVGSTVLTGLSCTTPGAIYSNTKGSGHGTGSSNTLYLCSGDNWLPIENQ